MSILANSNAQGSSNNAITNSLRFQSASSQYLSRTPASASNRKTWTWSAWVKLGSVVSSGSGILFCAGTGAVDGSYRTMLWYTGNALWFLNSNANNLGVITSAVYRDPSAWYHVVLSVDTTQATASERAIIYINGVRQATGTNTLTQNLDTWVNYTTLHKIGDVSYTSGQYFDGYMANVNFIDGLALTPSSFGATDPITGQWVATGYSGSYGTNGFYLPFSDGTSTATLGVDYSGNKNNWNLTNFTRSASASDCWMYDVPANNTGPGLSAFQPSSNYAVLNPLWNVAPSQLLLSKANLTLTQSGAATASLYATMAATTGAYYFETTITTNAGDCFIGLNSTASSYGSLATIANCAYRSNGQIFNGSTWVSYGASYTTNDVIGCAFDITNNTITFYKNNVSQGQLTGIAYSGLFIVPSIYTGASGNVFGINFGQRSFAYTPPSGFKALCTANLPQATILRGNKYMDATLYTGTSANATITNAGSFKPDLVWMKGRSAVSTHVLQDSVRGIYNFLSSETTTAEITNTSTLSSFNSNGFSIGNNTAINTNAATYVAWQWQAGQGTTSSNTSGSITSTVSVSTTAGFSVVTFTAQASGTGTVGHGLGVAPSMVILKPRAYAPSDWYTYHASVGATKYLLLNTTAAATTSAIFNNTAPTSTVFSLGTAYAGIGTMVAYCFAEIAGFSKFGSYTGNGSTNGPFVYCGFRPKFVMVKIYSGTTGDWAIFDTSRSTYNEEKLVLWPDLSIAESTGSDGIDGLANGFKIRSASNYINGSSSYSYIYMAFAESPFNISNAR